MDCSQSGSSVPGIPRQNGLPSPSPEDLPTQTQVSSPGVNADSLLSEPPGKPTDLKRCYLLQEIMQANYTARHYRISTLSMPFQRTHTCAHVRAHTHTHTHAQECLGEFIVQRVDFCMCSGQLL